MDNLRHQHKEKDMIIVKNLAALKSILPTVVAAGQAQPRLSLEDFHTLLKATMRIDATGADTPFLIVVSDEVSSRRRLVDLQAVLPVELTDAADLVDRALRLDDADAAKAAFTCLFESRFEPKVHSDGEEVERFEFVVEDLESAFTTSIHCIDYIYGSETLALLGGLMDAAKYLISEAEAYELTYGGPAPENKVLKAKRRGAVHVEGNVYALMGGNQQTQGDPLPQ
jgi:hypothetical protein